MNRWPERITDTPCRTGAARPAARGLHRAVASGEDEPVAVRNQSRRGAGLCAGPLLIEQELTSCVVYAGATEVDHDLQREHQLAVQVTVQGVPVALAVLEQDRRGPPLPGGMAHLEPVIQAVRPRRRSAQPGPPRAGDRQQLRVEGLLQSGDGLGERLGEVAVLAFAEPVPGHVDGRPEAGAVAVQRRDLGCLVGVEQRPDQAAAVGVQISADTIPVGGPGPVPPRRGATGADGAWSLGCLGCGVAHAAASRASRVRLASGPPR